MTNDRNLQLMQEALDDNLSMEEEQELSLILDENPDNLKTFNQLQRVDELLETAPHERAPERLALTIMARIAEGVKHRKLNASLQAEQIEINEAMIKIAMSLVTITTMPLLLGASWMLLNVKSNPKAFGRVLVQVTALFILIIDVMTIILEKAEETFQEDPEAAMALLTMMPSILLELVKQVVEAPDIVDDNG